MKKALFATTALVLSAGVAAADVALSGYGRTGVVYQEDRYGAAGGNDTQIDSRLRLNIDASTSTDQGIEFGARFRLQWDQNSDGDAKTNAGKLFVTANGLTVEIGNVDTAFDNTSLRGATELGAFDKSLGFSDRGNAFFAYESNEYNPTRSGVRVVYALDNLTLQASYVDPDQTGLVDDNEEIAVAVDYVWDDRLELSAAYVADGAGIEDNDIFFIGARYAVLENARIGLNYSDASNNSVADDGNTVAIYGDYTLADGLTNIEAYVANNDADWNETDNAFGIGVNYDLGGARLGASVQRGYDENVRADMGVRFEF